MNQSSLTSKKMSTGRLSVISHSQKTPLSSSEFKRKGTSFPKRAPQIEDICTSKQKGKYLMGWGQIPSLSDKTAEIQLINKDIMNFSCGDDHIVFTNYQNEAFGMGSNQFGQLGQKQSQGTRAIIIPILSEFKIQKVFCTQFATFFVTENNQLLACGLNNRGQLGVGSDQQKVTFPELIQSLSWEKEGSIHRKCSRNRISSVYYNQLKKVNSKELMDKQESKKDGRLISFNEQIKDIRGGPFHTLALTSKGRIFVCGNLYNSTSIREDEFSSQFLDLNLALYGNAIAIRSYLTGFGFLNSQNKLYLLGHFGQQIFDEPELLYNTKCLNFDINSNGIYVVDGFSNILHFNMQNSTVQMQKISLNQSIRDIYCGMDYFIAISKDNVAYGQGNNSQQQLCSTKFNAFNEIVKLDVDIKEEMTIDIKCSNNFVLCLSCKVPPVESSSLQTKKVKELERENKVLKELICNKSKKNMKTQTEKEGKFQFSKQLNPRTFDNSMEIPFEELSLGKQISEGGYGVIYKATWRKTTVAIKLFKIEQENTNSVRDFISQCHAMQALRHPNIVMFLGACTKPPNFAIVLEYCQGGTLWSLLQKHSIDLSWEERIKLALDVSKGMNYLHQRSTPILHRDLKSLNLLLDQNRRVKLADFGWTKPLQNYMTGKIGTYQWMAPQVISAFHYTEKADVYSFGIILWEIASRQAPYRNIPGPQVAQDVMTKDLRPSIPKKTPECFANLMQRCWDKQPARRPNFSVIISCLQEMKTS